MKNNYTITHCHTMFSNGVTNIDSVTTYEQYIDRAKELGMKAIAITEHGNCFEHYKKFKYCKEKGVKYIHGVEIYLTETIEEKIKDNYHCCLYAKNYEGFLEINKLMSLSFNRKDNHYYYAPRISFDELFNTSDNILVATACIGGVFKSDNQSTKDKYIKFLNENKHRCFLEIQHHLDKSQIEHNKNMLELHNKTGIPLILSTDTHALNETHAKGRKVLQKAKGIFFGDESEWDITLKTYDELINMMKKQNIIPLNKVYESLENTNKLADIIEEYDFDTSHKYPKLYDDSEKVFMSKIKEGILKRGINKYPNYDIYKKRILEELDVYKKVKAIDYMLLQTKIIEDAKEKGGVKHGYGRGSVCGSIIAYLLGITEMDAIKYNLNFFRFLNPSRVTNADIDVDFCEEDRNWIVNYLFNMEKINTAHIITFNTVADKGAIRDVCRALYDNKESNEYLKISNYICENFEAKEEELRKEYPDVFEYVDIIKGTIVSIGSHPSGFLVSDLEINETIGLCTLSGNDNCVTQLSMKPLDTLFYVKLDVLGLDSIGQINKTCELAKIERLTPDNIDLYDDNVWLSIRKDTTCIFQMESEMAHKYFETITEESVLNKIKCSIPNISMFDLFMFICGAIRPAGENFRDNACNGIVKDNGIPELNELLFDTMGYLLLQEQIMQFLVKFCGYSDAESDNVRRAIAKKGDTTPMLKEIETRFLEYTPNKYNVNLERAREIIQPFLLDIKSASGYGFSANHNNPYSLTGYISGYLRHYYPLEFLTVAFNINTNNQEKTSKIIDYANKNGIKINNPQYKYSKGEYFFDKETNSIYKGVGSIKNLNNNVGDALYELANNEYNNIIDLLVDIQEKTSCNSRQLETLIKLDYFKVFGNAKRLLETYKCFQLLYGKKSPKKATMSKNIDNENILNIIALNSEPTESTYKNLNWYNCLIDIFNATPNVDLKLQEKLQFQNEVLGYINYTEKTLDKRYVLITSVDTKYSPKVTTYCLQTGATATFKISKRTFKGDLELKENDFIYIGKASKKFGHKKVGEKTDSKGNIKPVFEEDQTKLEWWLDNYYKVDIDEVLESER